MRPPHVLLGNVLAVAALVGGLAACGGDPDPIMPTDSGRSTTTPSRSADPSATATPDTPDQPDRTESARAFITRLNKSAVDMQTTGSTKDFRDLTAGCESCGSLADSIDAIYADHRTVETSYGDVRGVQRVGGHDGIQIYEYDLVSAPTVVRDADGSVDSRLPGGSEHYQINIAKRAHMWIVTRLVRVVSQ